MRHNARPGAHDLHKDNVTVEQLKQLVEIQTQIVNRAREIEAVKRNRNGIRQRLHRSPRRLLRLIFELW